MWTRIQSLWASRRIRMAVGVAAGLLLLGTALWFLRLPRPPAPGIVATYQGGMVTKEDLRRYLHEWLPRGDTDPTCSRHGQEHDACPADESCETFLDCAKRHGNLHSLPVYREAAMALVVDRLIGSLVVARRLGEKKESRHLMKHVTEEIDLSSLHRDWHKDKIRVTDAEIRDYYERNRDKFGTITLSEATEQIRTRLVQDKEKTYQDGYLRDLRENANLTVNYDLLKFPEPDQEQLRVAFFKRQEDFRLPARAKLLLVEIPTEGFNPYMQALAQRVRSSLIDGKPLAEVNVLLADDSRKGKATSTDWITEKDPQWQTLALGTRLAGEVTDIVKDGARRIVARVEEREESRPLTFEEVREQLARQEALTLRQRYLSENKSATLFTIHGEAYSLGDFAEEFQELPESVQTQFDSFDGRKQLADRMVDRALILEGGSDDLRAGKNRKQIERVRLEVLKQVLHQEDVDDKIAFTDEELRAFFKRNQSAYRQPKRVKISLLRVDAGATADGYKRANDSVDNALAELKALSPDELYGNGFARVVKQYSTDSALAQTGGRIEEWIEETGDALNEIFYHQFHANVMTRKKGELTPVFRLGDAYCVALVRDCEEARERTFEEARNLIQDDMKARKHHELTARMEEQLVRQAGVRIYEYTLWAMLNEEGIKAW